jgi:Type III restriction enzyme, res subunit
VWGLERELTDRDPATRGKVGLPPVLHDPSRRSQHLIDRDSNELGASLRPRLPNLPGLDDAGLWPAQATAIRNLEESLADNRPRALIQLATGPGKTLTAANVAYRVLPGHQAKRICRAFAGPDPTAGLSRRPGRGSSVTDPRFRAAITKHSDRFVPYTVPAEVLAQRLRAPAPPDIVFAGEAHIRRRSSRGEG